MYNRILVILFFSSICLGGEGEWITYGPYGVSISSLSYSHSWGRVISPTICAGSDSQGVFFFDFDRKEWFSQNKGLSNLEIISIAPLRAPQTWNVDPHGFWVSVRDSGIFSGCIAGWFPDNDGLASLKTSLLVSASKLLWETTNPFTGMYVVVDNRLIFIKHYIHFPEPTSWFETGWKALEVTALHSLRGDPNVLYVGATKDGKSGLWKTTDWGKNWEEILKIETGEITSIVSPEYNVIYASTDSGIVYKSSDEGVSWDSSSLPVRTPILSLLSFHPDSVYVGTLNKGVYQSTDGGKTWREMNQGLIPKKINSLDRVGNTLYAGTPDGVWEYTIPQGISERREPFKNIRMEISPNPFKKSTVITLQLTGREVINLKVYNSTGRLVKTLLRGRSSEHRVERIKWDGRDEKGKFLPMGVYFIRLETKETAKTEKVILTR